MDVEWTYQLEVVLHGFTPEGTSASIREVGDYKTIYTGFFGGGSEVPSIVVPLASARAAEA